VNDFPVTSPSASTLKPLVTMMLLPMVCPDCTSDVMVAAPMVGVTRVGEVARTSAPLPVSSDMTPASSADVVAANALSLLLVNAAVPVPGTVRV